MTRLAFGFAEQLRPHGVASVAVAPGWMRTELGLAACRTDEGRWREYPELQRAETPYHVDRAVVALADPDVMRWSGSAFRVGDLARECGFTDVDGRAVPPFELEGV